MSTKSFGDWPWAEPLTAPKDKQIAPSSNFILHALSAMLRALRFARMAQAET